MNKIMSEHEKRKKHPLWPKFKNCLAVLKFSMDDPPEGWGPLWDVFQAGYELGIGRKEREDANSN